MTPVRTQSGSANSLFTFAAGSASAQMPSLKHGKGAGAVTDISGWIGNPGVTFVDENGNFYNPCPLPTEAYGQNSGFLLPPRQTGGDGVFATADTNGLNVGNRTQTTTALADATRGAVRAVATANVSPPCGYNLFMSAGGHAYAEFYDTYTVTTAPAGSTVNLRWTLRGSFSNLTSDWNGGAAYLEISLVTAPPSEAYPLALNVQSLGSLTWLENQVCSWNGPCGPSAAAPLVASRGSVDVGSAFSYATGRVLAPGDTFIIRTRLTASTRACGFPDGCGFLPVFTTDVSASAIVGTSGGAVVVATAFRP